MCAEIYSSQESELLLTITFPEGSDGTIFLRFVADGAVSSVVNRSDTATFGPARPIPGDVSIRQLLMVNSRDLNSAE